MQLWQRQGGFHPFISQEMKKNNGWPLRPTENNLFTTTDILSLSAWKYPSAKELDSLNMLIQHADLFWISWLFCMVPTYPLPPHPPDLNGISRESSNVFLGPHWLLKDVQKGVSPAITHVVAVFKTSIGWWLVGWWNTYYQTYWGLQ